MIDYEGGDLTAVRCCLWPVVGPLRGACVCRMWAVALNGLAALISDESALEVTMRYTNRQPLPLPFTFSAQSSQCNMNVDFCCCVSGLQIIDIRSNR